MKFEPQSTLRRLNKPELVELVTVKNDQLRRMLVREMELEHQLTEARTRVNDVADKAADNHENELERLRNELELSKREVSRKSVEKGSLQRKINQLQKLVDEQKEGICALETKQGTRGLLTEYKLAKKEIKSLKRKRRHLEKTVFSQKGEIDHLNKEYRRLQKQPGSDQARRPPSRPEKDLLRDPSFAREQLQSWISTVRQYLRADGWNDKDTVRRFGRLLTAEEKTKGKAAFRLLNASSCHHFQEYLDMVSLIDDIEPIDLSLEQIFKPAWDMLPEHAWKVVLTKMVRSEPRQRYDRIRKSIGKRWGKWRTPGEYETDMNGSASEISEEYSSDCASHVSIEDDSESHR